MIKILKTVQALQEYRNSIGNKTVGFVPTMGHLHEAHLSLVQQSCLENDITIVSIYINPTQFDNAHDLKHYPRTTEEDLKKLSTTRVDAVFMPDVKALYPDEARYRIDEATHSEQACGRTRPGHFSGAMTVVMKLLNLIRPMRSYFGEKDYQQLQLIREMVKAFFIPVEIIAMPLVREPSGLAMSSRNSRLSAQAREQAAQFHQILKQKKPIDDTKRLLKDKGFRVDYVEDIEARRLAAVFLDEVRLIDNIALEE